MIYPANDGGYTALVLPPAAQPSYCFANVHWSSHDTCISQLAALSRAGLRCVVGQTYDDVDELEDLVALDLRLQVNSTAASCCGPRAYKPVRRDFADGRRNVVPLHVDILRRAESDSSLVASARRPERCGGDGSAGEP